MNVQYTNRGTACKQAAVRVAQGLTMTDPEYRALLAHIHAVETMVLLLAKRGDAAAIVADMGEAREAVLAAGVFSTGPNGPDYAALVDFHL